VLVVALECDGCVFFASSRLARHWLSWVAGGQQEEEKMGASSKKRKRHNTYALP